MEPQLEPPEICEHTGEISVEDYLEIFDGEEFIDILVICLDCGELV